MLAVAKARLVEFVRQPEAVFWVYIFPLLMILVLGLAFRNQSQSNYEIDIVDHPDSDQVIRWLEKEADLKLNRLPAEECQQRLRSGKSVLVVAPQLAGSVDIPASETETETEVAPLGIEYWFDPTRPEAPALRLQIDSRLQRAAGRSDPIATSDIPFQESGGRYIDFLVPGLIGMGLMGGGLWGVGFAIVDLRIRKLLKRFVATPMRKADFLGGVMLSRMVFMIPEILLMLVFSWLIFGVEVQGSWWLLVGIVVLGAIQFSGIGLLVASRCKTLESASGLMNLVMLPMWTLCGIFFSWEKFPEMFHPFIKLLPLTPLIDALRAVVNDGSGLTVIWPQLAIISLWSVVSFAIALKIFRWKDN
jgi:ABC-type multidrug transport system permease subunit